MIIYYSLLLILNEHCLKSLNVFILLTYTVTSVNISIFQMRKLRHVLSDQNAFTFWPWFWCLYKLILQDLTCCLLSTGRIHLLLIYTPIRFYSHSSTIPTFSEKWTSKHCVVVHVVTQNKMGTISPDNNHMWPPLHKYLSWTKTSSHGTFYT